MKTIESFGKILSILTLFLIVLSSIKLAIFYDVFNITIVNYLSVTEYLPLFINDLHRLTFTILPAFLGFFLGFYFYRNKKEKIEKKYPLKEFSRKRQLKYVVITFAIIIFLGIVTYFRFETLSARLGFIQKVLILVFLWVIAIPTKKSKGFLYFIIWFMLLLSSALSTSAFKDAYEILENEKAESYEIVVNGKTINCDSPLHYVGRTEKYLFIYNSSTQITIVKNINDVEEIRISEKKFK